MSDCSNTGRLQYGTLYNSIPHSPTNMLWRQAFLWAHGVCVPCMTAHSSHEKSSDRRAIYFTCVLAFPSKNEVIRHGHVGEDCPFLQIEGKWSRRLEG